jgi:hypothetical protein
MQLREGDASGSEHLPPDCLIAQKRQRAVKTTQP